MRRDAAHARICRETEQRNHIGDNAAHCSRFCTDSVNVAAAWKTDHAGGLLKAAETQWRGHTAGDSGSSTNPAFDLLIGAPRLERHQRKVLANRTKVTAPRTVQQSPY